MPAGFANTGLGRMASKTYGKVQAKTAAANAQDMADVNQYGQTVRNQALNAIGPQLGTSLTQLQGYLGGAGPLADSGAATGLRSRLFGNALGQVAGTVAGGTSDLMGQIIRDRIAARRKREEEQRNKQGIGSKIGGIVGGVAGMIGGPALSAVGQRIGSSINPKAVYPG